MDAINDQRIQILDSDKVEGSIFELYEEATKFIAKSNYAWMEKPSYGNAELIDHFVIDLRVILEALVNMFAHRDYSKTRANLVHITPSFVELHSIGGLTEDLSLEDVVEHMATECRNPQLAHLFSLLNLMENRGSWGVSGISCPGRLLQVGNLARLPIFFMGFRLDLAFVGAEMEGPTRSVGGSSSDPTNAARGL